MQTGKDHLFIIGSGAIGKALAVFLRLAGRKVTLIRGSVDNLISKTQPIRVEMADRSVLEADIEITTLDTLNFEIVRIAESLHKSELVRETRVLGELIRLKSDVK